MQDNDPSRQSNVDINGDSTVNAHDVIGGDVTIGKDQINIGGNLTQSQGDVVSGNKIIVHVASTEELKQLTNPIHTSKSTKTKELILGGAVIVVFFILIVAIIIDIVIRSTNPESTHPQTSQTTEQQQQSTNSPAAADTPKNAPDSDKNSIVVSCLASAGCILTLFDHSNLKVGSFEITAGASINLALSPGRYRYDIEPLIPPTYASDQTPQPTSQGFLEISSHITALQISDSDSGLKLSDEVALAVMATSQYFYEYVTLVIFIPTFIFISYIYLRHIAFPRKKSRMPLPDKHP